MNASRASQLKGQRRHAPRAGRGRTNPRWHFLRGFLKHPVMVGSIIPSSRILIDRMLRPVDWGNTRLFVEYGPGVGTFTRPILERLAPDARLIAIDTNSDFIDFLNTDIGDAIGAATGRAIRDGGAFLVYQFSPKVRSFIAPHFERIDRGFEWINLPPATLFWAYRDRA